MRGLLKPILLLFLFSSIGTVSAIEKDSTLIKEMYSVINFFIEDHEVIYLKKKSLPFLFEKEIRHDQLEELEKFFFKIDSTKIELLFSEKDYVFMRNQFKMFKKLEWNSSELTQHVVLVSKENREKERIKFSVKGIFHLSVPLFNKELDKAMLFVIIDFGDSSAGFFYFLSKENMIWKENLCHPYFNASLKNNKTR